MALLESSDVKHQYEFKIDVIIS